MDFSNLYTLHNHANQAPFITILIVALLALFLSSLIAITYDITTKRVQKRAYFLQSIALIGVVAAMIIQAIGDSVAIGLGMLGALSIIRFRNAMSDPRNITFIFASLGSGIAVGVFGFIIATIGVLVFCTSAILLRFSPLGMSDNLIGELKIKSSIDSDAQKNIRKILKQQCHAFELVEIRILNPKEIHTRGPENQIISTEIINEDTQELTYYFRLKRPHDSSSLTSSLQSLAQVYDIKIKFRNHETSL